jgi:hypothetical protein
MGRFETQWLAAAVNLAALADLPGQWIDLVHGRRSPRGIVLDMDSSVSPTHGEQENSVKPSGESGSKPPASAMLGASGLISWVSSAAPSQSSV